MKQDREELIKKIYYLFINGYSIKDVAAQLSISNRTIARWLGVCWHKGDSKPDPKYLREEIWGAVCLLLSKDRSFYDISNYLMSIYGNKLGSLLIQSIKYYYNHYNYNNSKLNKNIIEN